MPQSLPPLDGGGPPSHVFAGFGLPRAPLGTPEPEPEWWEAWREFQAWWWPGEPAWEMEARSFVDPGGRVAARMRAFADSVGHVATILEELHRAMEAREAPQRDPMLSRRQQLRVLRASSAVLWDPLHLPMVPLLDGADDVPWRRHFALVIGVLAIVPTVGLTHGGC
ncbi:unnamed protein product [Closterium sp. Naga37s-1]|nr:unnamed protein product [Closterium sp. Naga37s-1]